MQPLMYVAVAVAAAAVLTYLAARGRRRGRLEGETVAAAILARLEGPGGWEIVITAPDRVLGRRDFADLLPARVLQFISRRHFRLFLREGVWYVEDLGSTNGTFLNGVDIRGQGPVPLRDGDVVSPAGVVDMVFRVVALPGATRLSEGYSEVRA